MNGNEQQQVGLLDKDKLGAGSCVSTKYTNIILNLKILNLNYIMNINLTSLLLSIKPKHLLNKKNFTRIMNLSLLVLLYLDFPAGVFAFSDWDCRHLKPNEGGTVAFDDKQVDFIGWMK